MSHMMCSCGNDMWDGDGEIVYDVFSKKDLMDYIQNGKLNKKFEDIYDDDPNFYEENTYFWFCNKCKSVHMWFQNSEKCYRIYEIRNNFEGISVDDVKNLSEYFVININEYGLIDELLIKDILENNPIRPFKYYVTNDFSKVYIVNTDNNEIDRIYDLTYESFAEYSIDDDFSDNVLTYTISKKNNGDEYIVKNGTKTKVDNDNYQYKQVNYMVEEKFSDGGSICYANPDILPKTYIQKIKNRFKEKDGKHRK